MRNYDTPMLIGSRAMDYWNDRGVNDREGSDWDLITTTTVIDMLYKLGYRKVEYHNPLHLNNGALYDHYEKSSGRVWFEGIGDILVAPREMLYILKRSHAWRHRNHEKTLAHLWKENLQLYKPKEGSKGAKLLADRTKLTKEAYPQGNPKLNQTVDDFFDDPVRKVYEHDWIHELYAFEDKPMFTRLQPDPSMAWCAKDLWEALTPEQRNQCVMEEAYVIATERFLVPRHWKYPTLLAYIQAVNKVCTTLCSGWFRDHAIDNYGPIIDGFDDDKVWDVKDAIENAEDGGFARYYKGKE